MPELYKSGNFRCEYDQPPRLGQICTLKVEDCTRRARNMFSFSLAPSLSHTLSSPSPSLYLSPSSLSRPLRQQLLLRTWYIRDSQGQILALPFRHKSLEHLKLSLRRLEAVSNHESRGVHSARPLCFEHGTYKTVKARFWPWHSGESPWNVLSCSLFVRKRRYARSGERPCQKSTPLQVTVHLWRLRRFCTTGH